MRPRRLCCVTIPEALPSMTADLREQLQAVLGPAYVIERELGGGGMSRVFVAV